MEPGKGRTNIQSVVFESLSVGKDRMKVPIGVRARGLDRKFLCLHSCQELASRLGSAELVFLYYRGRWERAVYML